MTRDIAMACMWFVLAFIVGVAESNTNVENDQIMKIAIQIVQDKIVEIERAFQTTINKMQQDMVGNAMRQEKSLTTQ